jgi:hypothetical protein
VFQIPIGPRHRFAFNGWRPDSQRKWREVIRWTRDSAATSSSRWSSG